MNMSNDNKNNMANTQVISIPEGIFYLGDYYQYLIPQLPTTSYIFNKVMTGCGATTMFLADDVPTVLCSPRCELIHCKANSDRFKGKVHLFGSTITTKKKVDSSVVLEKIQAMKDYVNATIPLPYQQPTIIPKILVTYDSTKHVIQGLQEMGLLNKFRFVVDEFQTLWTDAAFRGDTEAEFMENLKYAQQVIYLSATPYLCQYLSLFPEFATLPYIELSWPDSSKHQTDIKKEFYYNGSPLQTIKRIIDKRRNFGYFEELMDGTGNVHRATEAVFFVNDIKFIASAISNNAIPLSEVNIICSQSDETLAKLKKAGLVPGHAPKEGQKHPTYTFVSKAAYEGTDFYSQCAYTYIFSNINRNNMAIDISLDLPQIMGRQRLSSNIFRYSATFFHKNTISFTDEEKAEFYSKIKEKSDDTDDAIKDFESCTDNHKRNREARKYRNSQKVEKYQHDYISVVDDRITHQPQMVFNKYVMVNELRSWEVHNSQYIDGTVVMQSINDAFHCNSQVEREVRTFMSFFTGLFENKMKWYAEFMDAHPECREAIQMKTDIPNNYKEYYNQLGTDVLKACSWREGQIKAAITASKTSAVSLQDAVRTAFTQSWYSAKDVKLMLQAIYDIYIPGKTAKATDLETFLSCRKSKRITKDGCRCNGYDVM